MMVASTVVPERSNNRRSSSNPVIGIEDRLGQPLLLQQMAKAIYFLQQWFNLSDPQAEDAIYDSASMRRFVRVELGDEVVPDETTILQHLLQSQRLAPRPALG